MRSRVARRLTLQPLSLQSLEARRLFDFTLPLPDVDGDQFQLTITGPGTAAVTMSAGFGARSITVTGTTSSSNLVFFRLGGAVGDGRLHINSLAVTGDVGEMNLQFTTMEPEAGQGGFQGVSVTGKARKIDIPLLDRSDVSIGGVGNTNRTNLRINHATSTIGDPLVVTSSGFLEVVDLNDLVGPVTVSAARIGDMHVVNAVNNPFAINIATTDAAATYGLKTIRVEGAVAEGTWNIAGPVQSIRVGSFGSNPSGGGAIFFGNITGRLGSLITTLGDLGGDWTFGSAGTINSAANIRGNMTTTGDIDSLRARKPLGPAPITPGIIAARIKQAQFQSMAFFAILGSRVDSLVITGGPGDAGDITNCSISVGTLGTFTVAGSLDDTIVYVHNNAGAVRLGGMDHSVFKVGVTNPSSGYSLIDNLNQFTGGNTGFVKSFRLVAKPGDPLNFVNSFVAAFTFGSLVSTANINTANPGTPFGITFVQLNTSTSVRIPTIGTVTGTDPANQSVNEFRFLNL